MKIAVINFSGNVGKTTIARHLLAPRIPGSEVIAVESLNASDADQALRGRQFGELQEYLQTVDAVVVDIGASNVEDLLALMQRYRGSHEDFDGFIVPTVASLKQQQDTIATLLELHRLGVAASRMRLIFNMVETSVDVRQSFAPLLEFVAKEPIARAEVMCRLGVNEIYQRIKGSAVDLASLARDDTDYKARIVKATNIADKLQLAQQLANQRLARGVVPELDACFAALQLQSLGSLAPGNAAVAA
jgi:MinD-like ATPase involved in chromosome partitioning or flagellar assembly